MKQTVFQNLAAQRSYNNLDVTVKQALSHRQKRSPDGVLKCHITDSLLTIVQRVVDAEVMIYLYSFGCCYLVYYVSQLISITSQYNY